MQTCMFEVLPVDGLDVLWRLAMYVWLVPVEEVGDEGGVVAMVAIVNWLPSLDDDVINLVGSCCVCASQVDLRMGAWSLDNLQRLG